MGNQQLGYEVFNVGKSIKLPIIWTLIFLLPTLVLVIFYFENGNFHTLIFAFILLLPAIYMFIIAFIDRLTMYEKAIVEKTLFGTKSVTLDSSTNIYIENISDRMYGLQVARHTKIKVESADSTLKISSRYNDLEAVVDFLEHFQNQSLRPQLIEKLQEGQKIKFGLITLDKDGIIIKKKAYQWSEIERLTLDSGVFSIYSQEKKMLGRANSFIEVKDIPNLQIFLELVSMIMPIYCN